jgi:hypothetical protein
LRGIFLRVTPGSPQTVKVIIIRRSGIVGRYRRDFRSG